MRTWLPLFAYLSMLFPTRHINHLNLQGNCRDTIQVTDTIPLGYLNRDNIPDTAFVVSPKFINQTDTDTGNCVANNCKVTVQFSCNVPPIELHDAIGSRIECIGDINGDGNAEIVIIPWWFVSCWGKMHFYTLRKNSWAEFGEANCDMCREESYLPLITVKQNELTVQSFHWDDEAGDRIPVKKIVRLN